MATSDASTSLVDIQAQPLFDIPCSFPVAGPAGLALSRSEHWLCPGSGPGCSRTAAAWPGLNQGRKVRGGFGKYGSPLLTLHQKVDNSFL